MDRRLCGWREWAALPSLGIDRIKVKVDTGARTSALHAWHIQEIDRDGKVWVRFCAHPKQKSSAGKVWCEAPVVDRRQVRSSNGHTQPRYVIRTELRITDDAWPIELTLVPRDSMGFRMLVGRTAIRERLLVDPGRSYLLGKKPKAGNEKKTKGKH